MKGVIMAGTVKENEVTTGYEHATVRSEVKSYAHDPYFLKKASEAKEILTKVGLPKSKKK